MGGPRYMYRLTVEGCAQSALGSKQFVTSWIVQDSDLQLVITAYEGNGDTEDGVPVCEVRGPVERVDIPAVFCTSVAASAFFAHNAMFGPMSLQPLHNELLGGAIGSCHQVDFALVLNLDVAVEVTHQKRTGFASNRFELRQIFAHRARTAESVAFSVFARRAGSSAMYAISCLKMNRFGAPSRVRR